MYYCPLVTVVTPCYNAAALIGQTIDSVLAQSYSNWEMVIVDDCSTDSSLDIIEGYTRKDARIKYFKTDRAYGSPTIPRNIGIDNAHGEIIAFLDADDIWLPNKLREQVQFLHDNNYDFVYSNYEKIDTIGKRSHRQVMMPARSGFWDVLETCTIPCLTVLLTKDIIGNTRFQSIPKEDFVFWLEILKKNVYAYNTGKVHALYREQQNSRSSNKFAMIRNQWYILRNVEGVKPVVATYFMMKYLLYGFLKYIK